MFLSTKIVVRWDIIILELAVIVAISILHGRICANKYKKCLRAFENGEYAFVIQCEKLIHRFRKKAITQDILRYMIAVAYFMRNDDSSFLRNLNAITQEQVLWLKYYWLAVYALEQGDYVQYDALQEKLLVDSMNSDRTRSLEILLLACRHKREGYVLSDEDREKVANCNYDRIKQIFA